MYTALMRGANENAGLTNCRCAMLALQVSRVSSNCFCSSLSAANRMSTVLDDAVFEDRPEVDLSVLAASLRAEPAETVVLALDIGTSGVRSGLFNSRGDEIAGSQVSLSHEFADLTAGTDSDDDALIDFVECALDIAVARAESFVARIDYVAPTCFWHSLVGIDHKGRAV